MEDIYKKKNITRKKRKAENKNQKRQEEGKKKDDKTDLGCGTTRTEGLRQIRKKTRAPTDSLFSVGLKKGFQIICRLVHFLLH